MTSPPSDHATATGTLEATAVAAPAPATAVPPAVAAEPTAAAAPPTPGVAPAPAPESGDRKIEAIREILIGDQVQVLGQRFQDFEQRIEAKQAKIDDELLTKFEALKVLNESTVDDLGKSVVEMVSKLQEEDHAHSEEIKASSKRLDDLEQRIDDMRVSLTDHVRKMHEEFTKQLAGLSSLVESQKEEVARQSVSRKDFAKILNGLAGSIEQQEHVPNKPEAATATSSEEAGPTEDQAS